MRTYQTLKQAVEDYSLRTDAPFASLLFLAENEILRRIRTPLMADIYAVDAGDDGISTVVLPPEFIELISIKDKKTGVDIGCHRVGLNLILDKPIKNTTIVAEFYQRPPDLTPNQTTNPLLETYPSIYFNAVMSQLYVWSQDLEQSKYYGAIATNEIEVINNEATKQTSIAQNISKSLKGIN